MTVTHAHAHPHPHPHPHASSPELAQLGPSDHGSVMLDIGGDIGALVLHTPAAMAGAEIEISPVGDDAARSHVAVRERRGGSQTRWAAIYPALTSGTYTLWAAPTEPALQVTVDGGAVTEVTWPT